MKGTAFTSAGLPGAVESMPARRAAPSLRPGRGGCAPARGGDDGMKLDLKAFALAGGLFWGLGIVFLTWWLLLTRDKRGRGNRYGELIGRIYPGYRVSPKGSVIGLFWGFIDGFAAAGIFGLLYNHFAKKT